MVFYQLKQSRKGRRREREKTGKEKKRR